MRTKLFADLFGRLWPLSLALLTAAPLGGCSDLFASYLRFDEAGDGGSGSDGGSDPTDLLGLDLTGVDLTGFGADLTSGPAPCAWSNGMQLAAIPGSTALWFRIATGDFNGDGRTDIALAGSDNGGRSIKTAFILQNNACGFGAMISNPYPSAAAVNTPNLDFDFAAFKRSGGGGVWDAVVVGPETQIQWCSFNSGTATMACVSGTLTLPGSRTGEKKIIVDTSGRTESDHIVIHSKGSPDAVTRVRLSAGSISSPMPSFDPTGEPAFVVGRRHGSSTMALGISAIMNGSSTKIGFRTNNGTTYVEPAMSTAHDFMAMQANGNLIGYELYLYAGRFARPTPDDFDDLVALQKSVGSASIIARTFNVTQQAVAAPVTWAMNAVGPTHRDLVFVRDVDGDNVDELVIPRKVTATETAEIQVYVSQPNGSFSPRPVQAIEMGTTAITVDALAPAMAGSKPMIISVRKEANQSVIRLRDVQ